MARRQKFVAVQLALSPAMLAAAFGIDPKLIYRAIEAGQLEVRRLPGSIARRILVADAEKWFREIWNIENVKRRRSP
jgi:hypothetical protein